MKLWTLLMATCMGGIPLCADGAAHSKQEKSVVKPRALYRVYDGAWSADLDLAALPVQDEGTLTVGKANERIQPAPSENSFVIVEGLIRIQRAGDYRFRPGWQDSSYNLMTVAGKQVHRRAPGAEKRDLHTLSLKAGFHPFKIVFFKTCNPFAIWQEYAGSGDFNRMRSEQFWHEVSFRAEMEEELLSALRALTEHIQGKATLTEDQIAAQKRIIDRHRAIMGYNEKIIKAAFKLLRTYDDVKGPLWLARSAFNRPTVVNDIHWTVYSLMQTIMDKVYSAENIARYAPLLEGFKFGSSAHFPGAVPPPSNPEHSIEVAIDASFPETFGHPVLHGKLPARNPTGAYLAPGTIATVSVPPSLVDSGFSVRVGAHSWDNSNKRRVLRLDRSSLVYPVTSEQVKVASPLGGGIYIEVPYRADAGVVTVDIRNAVPSPFFSAQPFHQTSLEQWQEVERHHEAPWADFQTQKFMMQVPTSWITKLDDPVRLMNDWDRAMDAMNDLMGYPQIRGKETMYLQVDLQNRASVFAPGYPTVNDRYNPRHSYDGYSESYLVRGPRHAASYVFHEQGHAYLFSKYAGEMESAVNLLHVAVWNRKFDYGMDEAFRASRRFGSKEFRRLDTTAVAWMTSFNFVHQKPMQPGEKAYQLKGHAKFVDIADLFGWQVLDRFWHSINVDYEKGKPWPKNVQDSDRYTLRLCESAGVDLRPLLHFWGVPPEDPRALAAALKQADLRPAAEIYDRLLHYKSLIPANNADFQAFARQWWGKKPSIKANWTQREHARQWDHKQLTDTLVRPEGEIYNQKAAKKLRATLQQIIYSYFPNGRPEQMETQQRGN